MTAEKDIVLIYFEDSPLTYARIEEILPDTKRDWYHVKLLILQVPLQVTSWILRDAYINGAEFTMDGKKMRLEKVVCPQAPEVSQETRGTTGAGGQEKVIRLEDLKKRS